MKVNFNRYQVTKWMLKQCLMLRERLQLKVVWDVFYNHSTWGLLGAACLCTTSTCTALGDARVDEWNSDYPLGWEHYFSAAMTSQNCLCYKGNICIGLSASNILQQSSCQRWEHWSGLTTTSKSKKSKFFSKGAAWFHGMPRMPFSKRFEGSFCFGVLRQQSFDLSSCFWSQEPWMVGMVVRITCRAYSWLHLRWVESRRTNKANWSNCNG